MSISNGALPKPLELDDAEGNPSHKKKIKKIKPKSRVVKPPKDLSPEALEIWNSLAPELIAMDLLYAADVPMFAKFCDSESLYWKFRKELADDHWVYTGVSGDGNQYQQVNAKAALLHQAFTRAEKLANHFGISPASRARLGRFIDESKADPIESILGKKPD